MTLKSMVEHCLQKYPDTRNSDIKLTNSIWFEFYKDALIEVDGELAVKLLHLYKLPKEDAVKRWRAKFQNEKKLYLPTDIEVLKKRQGMEEKWRDKLGYNPELRQVLTN
jgi:hypothetical protein